MAEWAHTIVDLDPAALDPSTLEIDATEPGGVLPFPIYSGGVWIAGWNGIVTFTWPDDIDVELTATPVLIGGLWTFDVRCDSAKGTAGGGTWSWTLDLPPPPPIPVPPAVLWPDRWTDLVRLDRWADQAELRLPWRDRRGL
jgi:hypothetical protein